MNNNKLTHFLFITCVPVTHQVIPENFRSVLHLLVLYLVLLTVNKFASDILQVSYRCVQILFSLDEEVDFFLKYFFILI